MPASELESKPAVPPVIVTSTTPIADRPASPGRIARRLRLMQVTRPMGGGRIVSVALGGLLATALWIALFTVGLSVPSQPFRDGLLALAGGTPPAGAFAVHGAADALYALTIIAFSYTPTNLAMLCCLAALVGCLACTATNHNGPDDPLLVTTERRDGDTATRVTLRTEPIIPLRPAITAITWGFFIYLFIISGTLLAVDNPFSSTSPDQYLRLAGTASLLAFVVGWRPELVTRLVTQVGQSRIAVEQKTGDPK